MKLFLFVAIICICLERVSLQQQQEELNLKEQIQKLQAEVDLHSEYLKAV